MRMLMIACGLACLAYGENTSAGSRDISGDRTRHVVVAQGTPET